MLRFSRQKQEGMQSSGWKEYNGDDFGFYRLQDEANQVSLALMVVREGRSVVFRVEGDSLMDDDYPLTLNLCMYAFLSEPNARITAPKQFPMVKSSQLCHQ